MVAIPTFDGDVQVVVHGPTASVKKVLTSVTDLAAWEPEFPITRVVIKDKQVSTVPGANFITLENGASIRDLDGHMTTIDAGTVEIALAAYAWAYPDKQTPAS